MGQIFKDKQLNEFGCWALAYIPYGGADFGEIAAVADEVGEGDDSAFYGGLDFGRGSAGGGSRNGPR